MYKLYYSAGSCSLAVHVALIDIKAQFQLINVATTNNQPKPADFLKANPRGSVPVLEIDGFVLREGMAILTYLLDTNDNNLLPKSGLTRATTLEWLAFANSTLHPLYGRLFVMKKNFGDKADDNPMMSLTIKQIEKFWHEIDERLKNQQFIVGNQISIADILITVIANWSQYFGPAINFSENLKKYFIRVTAYSAFSQALNAENVNHYLVN